MYKIIIGLFFLITLGHTKESISLKDIFANAFGNNATVLQKNILLTANEKIKLQKVAKAKIDSPKVRFYFVKAHNNVVGYGVLLTQRIRTKKATILYLIGKDESIKSIEILSFKEPLEYKPNSTWLEVFDGKVNDNTLFVKKGIPMISGATMSARALSDAARIALTIVAKEKN
ncbi:MAG: FMN-binding protein [Campylobacterota bacterium]|nr:FMN-binding protein [Campylobacterota bacterium]